ncbi:MAG: HAD-IA family hydrolase [Gemmatimonadota bacterium]
MLRDFSTVLFDLDGTLIDSTDLILASYRHTMREHLGQNPPDYKWLETIGRPLRVQLEDFASDSAEAEAMMATYRAHNHEVHDDLVRPFQGIRGVLDDLRSNGAVLGIVTSKHALGTELGLRACELESDWFGTIVTSDSVEEYKPHPRPVLAALEDLGVPPGEDVLFIGDSVHDMRSGRAAGVSTGAAVWGPYEAPGLESFEPDYWLHSIAELRALVLTESKD